MKEKLLAVGVASCLLSFSVWAALSWVDYDTGDYQCVNGRQGRAEVCDLTSSRWDKAACDTHLAYICQ